MPSLYEKRHEYERFILELLAKQGALHRKDVQKKWIMADMKDSAFDRILYELRDNGYIRKATEEHYSPYIITDAGRRYLSGLQA